MTKPRPRFTKATPEDKELSRWTVQVGRWSPGCVVAKRVGQTGANWFAYRDGDPARAITYSDPRQNDGGPQGKARKFFSRREAADALLLSTQQPDRLGETELARSRDRYPSGGGPDG